MTIKSFITPAAVALTLALGFSARVDAQDRNRDNRSHSRESTAGNPQARGSDRAVARGADTMRAREQAQVQSQTQARARVESNARAADNRGGSYDNRYHGSDNRSHAYETSNWNDGHHYAAVHVAPRYVRVAPLHVYTPYPYRYRSGFSFGIFFGQPYPYRYSYPYPVPVYGYPIVSPGVAYGGISFGINPGDADVYVDGQYVGPARDFNGAAQPLTLSAGTHRIEMQAPGFQPLVFDVNIVPGQVMPYQGGMQPRY